MSVMVNNNFLNLKWALQKNGFMKINVFNEFQDNPDYLKYLDNLILDIKKSGTKNIQEKFIGGSEIFNFLSSINELEVGKKFLDSGFKVEFYPDKLSPEKSLPDFYATDSNYEYEVEVTCIIQDYSLNKLMDYLENQKYFEDDLTITINLDDRLTRLLMYPSYPKNKIKIKQIIGDSLNLFEYEVSKLSIEKIPYIIHTKMGSFDINKFSLKINQNIIIISWKVINKPIIERIKKIIIDKANKKSYLKIQNPKRIFLIFLIFEHRLLPSQTVKKSLKSALNDLKKGIFYVKPIVCNVGAVIGKRGRKCFIFANPKSKDVTTSPNFEDNLEFLKE